MIALDCLNRDTLYSALNACQRLGGGLRHHRRNAAKQLKHFFGIELPRGGHLHDILWDFAQQITDINPYVVSVALITLLSGIAV